MSKYKFYTWNNRFGNHLIAFTNLLNYAFKIKNGTEIIIPKHGLFNFGTNIKNKKLHKDEKTVSDNDDVIDVTRMINPTTGGNLITLNEMKKLCEEYSCSLKFSIPEKAEYDICIHIRDGDIFSHLVHFEYVQPSFDYYNQVLINNPDKSICILYSSGNSPIIPKLKESIQENKYNNVVFKHGKVEEDIKTLCSCKTLVWSFSSFCAIPFIFSKCLKKNMIPESIYKRPKGKPWFTIEKQHPENIKVIKHPKYILTGDWKNTPQQIEKILNYKLPEEEVEKIKSYTN